MTNKRKITPGYIFFYILFSIDTWRILIGVSISAIFTPQLLKSNKLFMSGEVMLYIMLAAMGWAIASYPATKIALFIRKKLLKGNSQK
jgi:hypothetical protein